MIAIFAILVELVALSAAAVWVVGRVSTTGELLNKSIENLTEVVVDLKRWVREIDVKVAMHHDQLIEIKAKEKK